MARNGAKRGDEALIAALAAGHSVTDAAKVATLARRTACRRLADPAFRLRVAEARSELLGQAIGKLAASSTEAAATLASLLDEGQAPGVRLAAARAILTTVVDLRVHEELAERVAELESRLSGGER
jgi:hypothetical protein